MTHRTRSTFATIILGVAGLILAASAPAAGQGTVPITATWEALPGIVPEGATVVVRTLDGGSAKGRLRRLSDSAIVLDGGNVRTIPASAVVSLEGSRGGRPVKRGARMGATIGIWMAAIAAYAALEQSVSSEPCAPDECVTWSDAGAMALVLPAMGAGIGAGVGLMVPGKRTLIYSAGAPVAPAGGYATAMRRVAAVRVTF
jgi:hypothetical protein